MRGCDAGVEEILPMEASQGWRLAMLGTDQALRQYINKTILSRLPPSGRPCDAWL